MKTILRIFTLLLLSISTKAQFPQPQGIGGVNTMLTSRGAFKADKLFTLPTLDTIHSYAAFVGSLTYRINDAHLYIANGSYWEDLQKDILFQYPASVRKDTIVFRDRSGFIPFFGVDSNMTARSSFTYNTTTGLYISDDITIDSSRVVYFYGYNNTGQKTATFVYDCADGLPTGFKIQNFSGYIQLSTLAGSPVLVNGKIQSSEPLQFSSNGSGNTTFYNTRQSYGYVFGTQNPMLSGNLFTIADTNNRVLTIPYTHNMSIGLTDPDASAKLDVQSTTQGFLPPRMTKAQRNLISSPVAGLVIYQTDNTPGLRCYNGTNWMKYTESTD